MTEDITALHVDDNEALRDLTVEFLERAEPRISVRSESDPSVVPTRIDQEPIDCVVSDYEMPQITGLELCKLVRRDHPDLPFFLFTNRVEREIIESALDVGVTDFVRKETGIEHYKLLANRITNAVHHRPTTGRNAELESVPEAPSANQG